jgi:AAA domain
VIVVDWDGVSHQQQSDEARNTQMNDDIHTKDGQTGSVQAKPDLSEPPRVQIPNTWSAQDLIDLAKAKPPEPIIKGLLNVGDIMLLHGTEESFKSITVIQCAESLATGTPFLRYWPVPAPWRVGIIETEMHAAMMGERLTTMFPSGQAPKDIYFMKDDLLKQWRREDLDGKFKLIERWIESAQIEVLIIDTANDFFRGEDSASEERVVGQFFDELRRLDLQGRIIVRHDRKRREVDDSSHSNELIRGSAEWKEDPEAIVYLKRTDKRTHEVHFEVGKLRYGTKPEPSSMWFDSESFRLLPLPPVIAVLELGPKSRQQIVDACKRFGLSERAVDDQLRDFKGCLDVTQSGHERIFTLNRDKCDAFSWRDVCKP